MSLLHPIISAWSWFKKIFVSHTESAASVAVVITESIKAILSNPIANVFENIADVVTHTTLPTNIATIINNVIPKILAVELAIEGLPDNPTEDQILAFEQSILKSFDVTSNNSKLYTVLSAQVYGIIQKTLQTTPGKFANWVNAVQLAYIIYKSDINQSDESKIKEQVYQDATKGMLILSNGSEIPCPIPGVKIY